MSWIDDLEERTRVRKELPLAAEGIRSVMERIEADLSPELRERLSEGLTQLAEVVVMLDEYAAQEEAELDALSDQGKGLR